jgi:hypothetical protein
MQHRNPSDVLVVTGGHRIGGLPSFGCAACGASRGRVYPDESRARDKRNPDKPHSSS